LLTGLHHRSITYAALLKLRRRDLNISGQHQAASVMNVRVFHFD
jgi:hypothetical protein